MRPDEFIKIRQKKIENGVMLSSEAVNELMEVAAKVLLQLRLLRLPLRL